MVHKTRLGLILGLASLFLAAATLPTRAQQADPSRRPETPCESQVVPKKNLTAWADQSHYALNNAELAAPAAGEKRIVFFGSSSIERWGSQTDSSFFPGKPYLNRGISGETSFQMLLRFQQDVVSLKPAAVVFLGGTNDIAGNTGPMTLAVTEDNIRAMAAIAQANGIKMILASQLPVKQFPWNKCVKPEADLLALSAWENNFAVEHHLGFVNFYAALAATDGSFLPGLSFDGVHPDKKAYEIMSLVAEKVIASVLNEP